MAPLSLRDALHRHVALLNDAHERCRLAFEAVKAARIVLQQGKMNSPTYQYFLCTTIENLRIGWEHLAMAIQDKEAPVRPVVADVRPDAVAAHPTAADTAPVRPVVADVRPDAVSAHPTAAETASVRSVEAHAPEGQNTNARARKSVRRRKVSVPVVADVRTDATHPTAAETAPDRPVVPHAPEGYNTTKRARKSVRRRGVGGPELGSA